MMEFSACEVNVIATEFVSQMIFTHNKPQVFSRASDANNNECRQLLLPLSAVVTKSSNFEQINFSLFSADSKT